MGRLHSLGYTIKTTKARMIRKNEKKGSKNLKKLIPETFTEYQFISSPLLSPDGQYTAFVAQTMDMENNCYIGKLYVIDTKGGTPRQMSEKDIKHFIWTPDGTLMYSQPAGEEDAPKMAYLYGNPGAALLERRQRIYLRKEKRAVSGQSGKGRGGTDYAAAFSGHGHGLSGRHAALYR